MKRRPRNHKAIADINITPFTDVILVLLMIFMIVTPLIFQSSIKIKLPEAEASGDLPKTLILTINQQGDVFIQDDKYNLRRDFEILKYKLSSLVKQGNHSSVVINGDKDAEYDYIIKALDLVNQVGIRNILLGVQPKVKN